VTVTPDPKFPTRAPAARPSWASRELSILHRTMGASCSWLSRVRASAERQMTVKFE
jgi:hypothetical protein